MDVIRGFPDCLNLGSISIGYSMFGVGYGIYTRELITSTEHCITYLALTQLFPVLLTSRFHIVKYAYYVVCCYLFDLGVDHFFFSH